MSTQDEIMDLERRFWQSMMDMDVDAAVALLNDEATSADSRGIHYFGPAEYRAMALAGKARITSFEFFDERVIFPLPDVAIASYKAHQSFEMEGEIHRMVVHDTTTWVRTASGWRAAAHTETPAHDDGAGRSS